MAVLYVAAISLRAILSDSLVYTFAGYNTLGTTFQKLYSDNDMECAEVLSENLITGMYMYEVRYSTSSTDLMLRTIATA